jgi:hypothetical protein
MSVLKQYNTATSQWEAVVIGKQGPSGTVAVSAPLTNSGTSTAAVLGVDYAALQTGQNSIINGGFDFWQRGTSFTPASGNAYVWTSDRWAMYSDHSGGTVNVSRQAFTPGDMELPGVGGLQYYSRLATTSPTGANYTVYQYKVEDVRSLAGQTVTISYYGKADAGRTIYTQFFQNFGSGGSSEVYVGTQTKTMTTTWTRYSHTFTIPSVAGKTINGGNNLRLEIKVDPNTSLTFDLAAVQLEVGTVATPFKRHAPSLQGELAACQRYYVKFAANIWAVGTANASNQLSGAINLPVPLRDYTTSVQYSGVIAHDGSNYYTGGTLTAAGGGQYGSIMAFGLTFGSSVLSTFRPYRLANIDGSSYIAFSSEL